jgi:hypothetical protein
MYRVTSIGRDGIYNTLLMEGPNKIVQRPVVAHGPNKPGRREYIYAIKPITLKKMQLNPLTVGSHVTEKKI